MKRKRRARKKCEKSMSVAPKMDFTARGRLPVTSDVYHDLKKQTKTRHAYGRGPGQRGVPPASRKHAAMAPASDGCSQAWVATCGWDATVSQWRQELHLARNCCRNEKISPRARGIEFSRRGENMSVHKLSVFYLVHSALLASKTSQF